MVQLSRIAWDVPSSLGIDFDTYWVVQEPGPQVCEWNLATACQDFVPARTIDRVRSIDSRRSHSTSPWASLKRPAPLQNEIHTRRFAQFFHLFFISILFVIEKILLLLNGKTCRRFIKRFAWQRCIGGRWRRRLKLKTPRNAVVGRDDVVSQAIERNFFTPIFHHGDTCLFTSGINVRRGWLLSWPTSKPLLVHSPAAISRLLTNSFCKSCRTTFYRWR